MGVCCNCIKCGGKHVPAATKRNHDRAALKTQTVLHRQQAVLRPDLATSVETIRGTSSATISSDMQGVLPLHLVDPRISSASTSREDGAFKFSESHIDLDVINPHDNHFDSDLVEPSFDQLNDNPIEEFQEDLMGQGLYVDQEEFPDEDTLPEDEDLDRGEEIDNSIISPQADPIEDDPDPFMIKQDPTHSKTNILDLPDHLLVIYTLVCWLHMQFKLPRIACNAVLAILACLIRFLNPGLQPPFITLPSITRTLAVDPPIELLPVCPNCRDVFLSAASQHVQDACTSCKVPLFLPSHTNRGNLRNMKTPLIKYPYLPLSQQLVSLLKIPGIEALLDNWRNKQRTSGEYRDIFDGDICRKRLRAPDGSLFFSNLPHEGHGPSGELRIGVNLGVDWYVLMSLHAVLTHSRNRFSYIRSNIAPSHSSCPTSFSICNLPPEYR